MIYVLLLQENKLYVGFSERPIGERFIEHFNYRGSKWTTLYRPVQVLQVQPGGIEEENEMTLRMMDKYGWWNVRGGSWCQVDIQSCPPALLEWQRLKLPDPIRQNQSISRKSSRSRKNGCSRCGHLVKDCYHISSDSSASGQSGCYRCGRNTHFAKDCYARSHINGVSSDSSASGQSGCYRCGRNTHFAKDCYARTHINGVSSDSSASGQSGCYRCGRNTHFAKDCYARTHINGFSF